MNWLVQSNGGAEHYSRRTSFRDTGIQGYKHTGIQGYRDKERASEREIGSQRAQWIVMGTVKAHITPD